MKLVPFTQVQDSIPAIDAEWKLNRTCWVVIQTLSEDYVLTGAFHVRAIPSLTRRPAFFDLRS